MRVEREKTIQILPTISEARIIRQALVEYVSTLQASLPRNESAIDKAWNMLSEISKKILNDGF